MSTSSKSQFNQVISAATHSKFRGRQLLDHEGLSCLFILLFIDAKLNTTRLHRIPRSLCYHAPTRDWVVRCLLSILEKASVGSSIIEQPAAGRGPSPSGLEASATPTPVKLRKSMSGKETEAKAEKEEKRGGGMGGSKLLVEHQYGRCPWLQSQCVPSDPIWWSRWKEVLIVLCINLCPPPSCPCSVQAHPRGAHLPRQRRRRRKPKKELRSLPRRKVSPPQWRLTRRKRRS